MSTRTYLDHAASSPVRPEVAQQISTDLQAGLGQANPTSQHTSGRQAGALLAQARAQLAQALAVDPHEIIFTSGGSEADGLAIMGSFLAARKAGIACPHLAISAVEHPAVSQSAQIATTLGADLTVLPVDNAGMVDPQVVTQSIKPGQTTLVSIMSANNETGAVQDLPAIISAIRRLGSSRRGDANWVAVHTDAVAAIGKVPIEFSAWDLDAMSLTGHKLGAPVGVGALIVRREITLLSPLGGGRQERGIRSGTPDVIGARALALAVSLAVQEREEESQRLEKLRQQLLQGACALPGVHATLPSTSAHLPSTAHLWFEDVAAEALLLALDLGGIDASAGSACHAGVTGPSTVLLAMGFSDEAATATLRCSFAKQTTSADIDKLLTVLPNALEVARRAYKAHENLEITRDTLQLV